MKNIMSFHEPAINRWIMLPFDQKHCEQTRQQLQDFEDRLIPSELISFIRHLITTDIRALPSCSSRIFEYNSTDGLNYSVSVFRILDILVVQFFAGFEGKQIASLDEVETVWSTIAQLLPSKNHFNTLFSCDFKSIELGNNVEPPEGSRLHKSYSFQIKHEEDFVFCFYTKTDDSSLQSLLAEWDFRLSWIAAGKLIRAEEKHYSSWIAAGEFIRAEEMSYNRTSLDLKDRRFQQEQSTLEQLRSEFSDLFFKKFEFHQCLSMCRELHLNVDTNLENLKNSSKKYEDFFESIDHRGRNLLRQIKDDSLKIEICLDKLKMQLDKVQIRISYQEAISAERLNSFAIWFGLVGTCLGVLDIYSEEVKSSPWLFLLVAPLVIIGLARMNCFEVFSKKIGFFKLKQKQ